MQEKYITQYFNKDGKEYGFHIWATSYKEAEQIANERGIGEKVLGHIPHDCDDCEWEGTFKE